MMAQNWWMNQIITRVFKFFKLEQFIHADENNIDVS